MGTYNNLLMKYDEYLKRDEVEDTDEVISALTLWNVVQDEIEKFQYYRDNNYGLLCSINHSYAQEFKNTFCSGTDLYDIATENLGVKIPTFRPLKFIGIKSGYINNNKTAVIEFILNTKVIDNREKVNESIKIYRDFNDDTYYGSHINNFLVYSCGEQLNMMVDTLKDFAPLVDSNMPTSQIIDNGILNVIINHSLIGKPSLKIKLSKSIDPDDSQYKKYVNEFCTIAQRINGKEDDLLERTSIKVDDLNLFCKTLIKRHLEIEKQKTENIETNKKVYAKTKKVR